MKKGFLFLLAAIMLSVSVFLPVRGIGQTNNTLSTRGSLAIDDTVTILATTERDVPAGTVDNPYTVAQARAAVDAHTGVTDVYVKGIVTMTYWTTSTSVTYWISDDGTESNEIKVSKGKGLHEVPFSSDDDIMAGDVVVVYGSLSFKYADYRFNEGNYLISLERKLYIKGVTQSSVNLNWKGNYDSYTVQYKTSGTQPVFFFEDFENAINVQGWTVYTNGESPDAEGWNISDAGNNTNHSGNSSICSYSWVNYCPYNADNWLVSPKITIQGTLVFWVYSNWGDKYEVLLSTGGNAIDDFAYTLKGLAPAPRTWTEVSIPLSGYSGEGYIAIHHKHYDGSVILVDDFGIYDNVDEGEWQTASNNVTDTPYILSGLGSGTRYEVRVKGTNSDDTHYCEPIAFTTIRKSFTKAGNWGVDDNWLGNAPNGSDKVIIAADCIITENCEAKASNIIIGEGGSLTIADGGQLVCKHSVEATVQKVIAGGKDTKDLWCTISSSVHTGSNPYITIGTETTVNLTADSYDMFAYKESEHKWLNKKPNGVPGDDDYSAGFDVMNAGQGYIYRNSGNTLSFVGNTNVGAVAAPLSYTKDLDVANFKGFNLIGNPYTHSIAKGSGKAIDNENLSSGCYILSNTGAWILIADGEEIKPNQGILVETKAAVDDFQIQDIDYVNSASGKYNNDNIRFSVSNNEYEDVTYAWFDKGHGLTKINHRNDKAPMLYIPQDGHNYAVAIMSDDTKVFGLNFKAATMGQYTLSYKADGNFDYLHVIDRLTGNDIDLLLDEEYTFIATPNDSENRFIVKLEYMPEYREGNGEIFAYQTGSELLVTGEGELQIFDVTGRMVLTKTINGAEGFSVSAQGVYILRLVGTEVKTQKIVVR